MSAAVALVSLGATPDQAGATGTPAPPAVTVRSLSTPLLSPRRLPQWLATTVAAQRLLVSLRSTLAQPLLAGAGAKSCLVVSQAGATLAAINPTLAVDPASNMKLLTATAVLDRIGPSALYTTKLVTTAPVAGGVLRGNLFLVGAGDPLLRTPGYQSGLIDGAGVFTNVTQLAAQVRAAGITEITGSVLGDDSRYDAQRAIASWPARYAAEDDFGPLSALEINDDFLAGSPGVTKGAQPPAAAAQYFTTLLAAAGVRVVGTGAAGVAPAGARTVTSINSAPMASVVGEILRESDDTGAELLVKELGARFGGAGTTAAGLAVERADLSADGLPLQGAVLVDGSGLDLGDRVTCQLETALLARAGPTGVLAGALPVAGKSGTLHARLLHTAAAGRVLAKTGTLFGVSALSGFVEPGPNAAANRGQGTLGGPLVFSLILNGLAPTVAGEGIGVTIGNQVALVLTGFPTTPLLAELAPLPAHVVSVTP
jgi:D-alanyl-D-alanine carboxypeptidase/D-alanyl-D-alanine-endopeptidase (penicillin-binding protein 4)